MARKEVETKLLQTRQATRDLLKKVVRSELVSLDQYKKLKVRVAVCNELLREYRQTNSVPVGKRQKS